MSQNRATIHVSIFKIPEPTPEEQVAQGQESLMQNSPETGGHSQEALGPMLGMNAAHQHM